MKTICFIANYSKTFLFDSIASHLRQKHHIEVCWIVVNRKLNEYLQKRYSSSRILYLNRSHALLPNEAVDDFGLNEIIYGDRALRLNMDESVKFLTNIQKPLQSFIRSNKIDVFFAEPTWGHELLIGRMAAKMSIPFLNPEVVRIPNGRFGFFLGAESHKHLLEIRPATNLNGTGIFQVQRPAYLKIFNNIIAEERSLIGRLNKLKRFFTNENIDKEDPTIISNQKNRFKSRASIELNREVYYLIKRTSFEKFKNERYVLHTLHKQPESTIDVFGRYYEDQFQFILNLWRKLPHGWKLVIKEHQNAIGDRPYSFYKKISRYPGIIIADEKMHSHDLIKSAQLVATVAGTVAYEAALMQVPAVIFSETFFCKLSGCLYKTLRELAECNNLKDWVREVASRPDNRSQFCEYVINNSFEANMTDPVSDPSVMEPQNIEKLVAGFHHAIEITTKEIASPKLAV